MCLLAPGPPSNIKVDVLSSHELNTSWDLPAEANGLITKYKVAIYEKGEENVSETQDTKFEKSKIFSGLEPFTTYMVKVQASTKAGRGNWSDPVETRTYPERKIELISCHSSNSEHALVMSPVDLKMIFIAQWK